MPAMNARESKFVRGSGWIVRLLAAVFFAMLFQRPASASLILGRHDWSPGTPDWQSDHGFAQLTYGLDDFSLMVPEPSQFLMLGAALAASGFSLRRRRS